MPFLLAFTITGVIFAIIDAVWLKMMRGFYEQEMGSLLRKQPNIVAAIVFYVLYILGVVLFVVLPALATTMIWQAGLVGALFGLIAYGTYDLTNLATLKNWSVKMTAIDMVWGAFVTGLSALLACYLLNVWAIG